MVRCAKCGRENDDALAACVDCGEPLAAQARRLRAPIKLTQPAPAEGPAPRACPTCGGQVPASHLFCGACGTRLGVAAEAGQSPTRLMTGLPQAPEKPRFRLVGVDADGRAGPSFAIAATGRTVAGRDAGEVRLTDDPHVSASHAAFELKGVELEVTDLESGTGTWIRLDEGERRRLGAGDALRIGRQRLDLEAMPPPREAPGGPRIWGSRDPGYLLRLVQHLDGGGVGRVWPLAEGEVILGRDGGEVLFPDDGFVSGRHGRLSVGADGWATYEDLGSSNGSYLRLRRPTPLRPGDLVLLGTHLLRVEVG